MFSKHKKDQSKPSTEGKTAAPPEADVAVNKSINKNLTYIKEKFGMNSDLRIKLLTLPGKNKSDICIVYLNEWIDDKKLDKDLLNPLLQHGDISSLPDTVRALPVAVFEESGTLSSSILQIFNGKVLLFIEGEQTCFLFTVINPQNRSIQEPETEKVVRGPREGFVENLDINLLLIRRKLKDHKLVIEEMKVGRRAHTRVAVLYIDDIIKKSILAEMKKRISQVDVDGLTGSGMLEQLIEDSRWSPFPQFQGTERPDRVAPALMQGRICIICEGTPVALLAPSVLSHFLSATEDYYERTYVSSFNRLLRYFAFFITLTLPSLYIALVSFNPELLPIDLLLSLAQARKELPFPPLLEALVLELAVEFLREMGLRLPEPVGKSLGVVGGIVLGDAAIRANLVSPAMVIVVGITAIVSFTIPVYSMVLAVRLLRFPMMFLAGLFGVFGITIGWLLLLGHLMRLESFSIPYFSPFAPMRYKDLKDTFLRFPLHNMKDRPKLLNTRDDDRKPENS